MIDSAGDVLLRDDVAEEIGFAATAGEARSTGWAGVRRSCVRHSMARIGSIERRNVQAAMTKGRGRAAADVMEGVLGWACWARA